MEWALYHDDSVSREDGEQWDETDPNVRNRRARMRAFYSNFNEDVVVVKAEAAQDGMPWRESGVQDAESDAQHHTDETAKQVSVMDNILQDAEQDTMHLQSLDPARVQARVAAWVAMAALHDAHCACVEVDTLATQMWMKSGRIIPTNNNPPAPWSPAYMVCQTDLFDVGRVDLSTWLVGGERASYTVVLSDVYPPAWEPNPFLDFPGAETFQMETPSAADLQAMVTDGTINEAQARGWGASAEAAAQ